MSDITTKFLDEVYDFKSGLSKSREEFGFGNGFVSFKDVFYNFFLPKELSELANTTEREQESCSVQRGDVFLTRTSETFDELGMSSVALKDYDKATFNGFTKRLRPKNNGEIWPEYIGYYFRSKSFRNMVTSMATMSTRASLNNEILSKLQVKYPPLPEQKAIAHILGTLDEKIELNRQMNQTLEAMAQAMFKSWFVDFDPVIDNALAAGNEIPDELQARVEKRRSVIAGDVIAIPTSREKQTQPPFKLLLHTNPTLAAQFPASFIFNEKLGKWIPEGWEVKSLENICEQVIRGFTTNYVEKSNLINLNQKVNKGDILEKQHFKYYPEDTVVPKDKFARKHDILMNSLGQGTLGRVHYYKEDSKNVVVDQHITIIRASIGSAYIYHFLKYKEGHEGLMARITGSTGMLMLNVNVIRSFEIPLPNQNLLGQFQRKVEGLYSKINSNDFETETLIQLRDRLLQELISGRVRVKDFDKIKANE
jgi:type I restriction enzyme S subunit